MSDHRIPDMCDPNARHRHECPICHEVEECDDTQCRFLYAGFGSQPGDELAPPASPVQCGKWECMQAHISKMNEGRPFVECVSCGGQVRWNVEGRCYECDKHDVPPRGTEQITEPLCACGKPSEISTETETGFVEQCRACYERPAAAAAKESVNHPPHYNKHPSGVECITVVEHFGFNIGNAIKYLWRCGLKGSEIEDLKKAVWYVQREIEKREKEATK